MSSKSVLSKIYFQKPNCIGITLKNTFLNNIDIHKINLIFHYKTYKKLKPYDCLNKTLSCVANQIPNLKPYNYISHYLYHRYLHHHHYCKYSPSIPDFKPRSLHKLVQCVILLPEHKLRSKCDIHSL